MEGFLIIIGLIIFVVVMTKWSKKEQKKMFDTVISGTSYSRIYQIPNSMNVIVYSKETKEIMKVNPYKKETLKTVRINDVIDAKVSIDGKTSGTSDILMGGATFGNAGAVLAGIAANMITEIKLQFTTKDIDNPLIELELIESAAQKDGKAVKSAMLETDYYLALIKAYKSQDKSDKQ